jgi:hypothetical protein
VTGGIARLFAIRAETGAARRHQCTQLGLVRLRKGFREQMRKSIGGTLSEPGVEFGVQVPILGLVLTAKDAALTHPIEALFQFLWVDTAQKFFEGSTRCGEGRGILRLEFS